MYSVLGDARIEKDTKFAGPWGPAPWNWSSMSMSMSDFYSASPHPPLMRYMQSVFSE